MNDSKPMGSVRDSGRAEPNPRNAPMGSVRDPLPMLGPLIESNARRIESMKRKKAKDERSARQAGDRPTPGGR